MKRILLLTVLATVAITCRTPVDPWRNTDPITGLPRVINNAENVKINDSIVKIVDATRFHMPEGIRNSTLVIETYNYPYYSRMFDNKYEIYERDWYARKLYKRH